MTCEQRESRGDVIAVVTTVSYEESRLCELLQGVAELAVIPVEQVSGDDGVEIRIDTTISSSEACDDAKHISRAADDATVEPGAPDGIVVELRGPQPETLEALLERVRGDLVEADVPTVVAPWTGSEKLAATAVRVDADEYVPVEDVRDPTDRILESVSSRSTESSANVEYQHIIADELPDEAFVINEDGVYLETKMSRDSVALYTMSPEELTGKHVTDAFPDDEAKRLLSCIDRALETGEVQSIEYDAQTVDGIRRFEARVVPVDDRIDGERAVVWLARDITERAEREQELRSRRAELETLNRINAVVRRVIETLVEASTREAIEEAACEQLVASDLYSGAWIAEQSVDGDLAYRTDAGEAETYLERVREIDIEDERPVERVARTGDVETVNHVLENNSLPPALEDAACEDEVRAAIAVPIVHEDVTYGVLSVLASREDAFSESEQAGFELLGETMGFAIMAVRNRQLLFADSVIELEFRIDGGDSLSFDLSEKYDCTCSLEWAGTGADGRTYQFVNVDGISGETVLEAANAHESIEESRVIHDGSEQCTLELRLSESGVRTLANHGATLKDVTVTDGIGTCLIEVPQNADVREIAEALSVVYENTELVARRDVDRPIRTAAERRDRILDELTERQLTTLRLAYYGGFFDWPRESTGEEIAEMMDVSPPTMHQHLRKGLKTVLGEFFEEHGKSPADTD
ncbi:bacterio-opsin activator domain-containing protein [Halobiforma nitratireducens]|uniref:PAS sensor protein n=1 Tax=Halobiforma nitratireducens JCM 10879 TaxID=1227454 RepID=M0M2W8_9EURY|nr:bacterio-opsin activator domain-containing protein [Halobiforma nitratireducens]EMA38750.1 PAS sensor protein [Halobiforma nitratireducens JCM 10879]